jgi:nitrile hydratase accessory protein
MLDIPSGEGFPQLPIDEEGPVFRQPWEAQAFALVLKLYQGGHFAWPEWVEYLSREINEAKKQSDHSLGQTYYQYWLAALEKLAVAKGFTATAELALRKAEIASNVPGRRGHVAKRDPVRIA